MNEGSTISGKTIFLAVILLIAIYIVLTLLPTWKAQGKINEGNALLAQGKYDEAVELYKEAQKIKPKMDEPYIDIGLVYWRMEEIELAMKQFQKATEINPNSAKAYYYLAIGHSYFYRVDDAVTTLLQAIAIDPDYKTKAKSDPGFLNIKQNSRFQEIVNY
jgi:tetratricopeptide (TPR) repeat protein